MQGNCAVCLEELGISPIKLECDHHFHAECILGWFRRGHAECPSCRDIPVACNHNASDSERLGIVTETTLNKLVDNLNEHREDLDADVLALVNRFYVIRSRLRRLRACSCFMLLTTCRPVKCRAMSLRQRRCQDYAEEATYYESELSGIGAELLAQTYDDGDTSEDLSLIHI